jgi:hypothetical protein
MCIGVHVEKRLVFRGKFVKIYFDLKMALLANPDDIEMYLLGAEIAHYSGEISNSRDFFSYAKELLKEMAKNQTNLLDVSVLSGNLSRCGRLL